MATSRLRDDDDDEALPRCLPVQCGLTEADVIARAATGAPPMSAEEYLMRVRLEARALPGVTKASPIDPAKLQPQTRYMPAVEDAAPCDPSLLPPSKWQDDLVANVSELRRYLARWEARGVPDKVPVADLPEPSDRPGWHERCFGVPLTARRNGGSGGGMSRTDGTDGGETGSNSGAISAAAAGAGAGRGNGGGAAQQPLLSLVLSFDEVTSLALLRHHVSWLCQQGGHQNAQRRAIPLRERALWIFALLLKIDKAICAETGALLRRLLRRCAQIRAALEKDSSDLAYVNLIITVADRYFGQGGQLG